MQFLGIGVASLEVTVAAIREVALAFVSREIVVAVCETVTCHHTSVFATVALHRTRRIRGRLEDLVQRNTRHSPIARIECTTKCAHQFRTLAAEHLPFRKALERPYDGIVAHRTALYHDTLAEFVRAAEFQHLVKAVLDHRIRQTCRNIGYRRALAQHLLDLRVHEYRTARPQIARELCRTSQSREIRDRISEALGESLDEGSAPRRAGFVDLHTGQHAAIDKNRLDVLPSDVEYERHVGRDLPRSDIMGYGLYYTVVEAECGLYKVLAVTGRTPAAHDRVRTRRGALFGKPAQPAFDGCDRIAVVGGVIREEEVLVPVDGDDLRGRRTRIYAQQHLHASCMQRRRCHQVAVLGFAPRGELPVTAEYRLQGVVRTHAVRSIPCNEIVPFTCCQAALTAGHDGCAPCRQQLGVGRHDYLLFRKMEVIYERLAQRRQEGQRPAAEENRCADVAAMRERNHSLHGDGMEYRRRNILTCGILGDEVLDVGLGENAASRRYGINVR